MLQKTATASLLFAICAALTQSCGQTSLGTAQSSAKVDTDRSKSTSGDPESEKAQQPQSVAGAYLTCGEYTKLPSGPAAQYAVGCKVMNSDKKKMPMLAFPDHEWRVTDNNGTVIAAQPSYPVGDPDADAVIAIEKSKALNGANVQFTFDKKNLGVSISFSIKIKTVTSEQLSLWRTAFGGLWSVSQTGQDSPIGDVSVEFVEGTTQALIKAVTDLRSSSLLDKILIPKATPAGTIIIRGELQQDAEGMLTNLILKFDSDANVTVTPQSFKNKNLKFAIGSDGKPILKDTFTTWVFSRP